ncbi:hypothetical protein ARMGADRAFT_1078960 [Armillaria gallica]|uniref:BTB domain-containing protein n=1 Tax=Armillaria gallica TaxID=47427 RepID=A0A2H3DTW6_ARMGA|nr:hypothetical protein ARMGADRAFT_1078960 [Armillaria gallica]
MPTSSLQQKGRDQWSTKGPLSIRSTFTFHLSPGSHYSPRCGWGWMFSVEYGNEIFAQDCTKLVAYFDYASPGGTDFLGPSLTVSGAISGPSVAHSLGDKVDIKMGPSSAPQIVKRTVGSCHLPLADAVFTLEFTVTFPFHETIFSPIHAKAAFSSRASRALRDTIETGELIDTKFYLFSRRLGEGQAYCPKALFSSSRVILGASDYIDVLLGGSAFSESKEVDIDEPVDIQAGDYSYDADSDLESDDGYDDDVRGRRSQSSASIKTRPRLGRVCVLKDIAYKTFKALLVYLYTEDITFTSIKSKTSPPSNFGPGCSPKSMYRLADMINHEPLKKLALANLQTQLTKENICSELFSEFTSWYPEVLNIEVKFTLDHWSDPVVQDNRKAMFKRLVDGQFPYAWPAFNAIMEKMRPASGTVVPISPLVVPRRRESPLPAAPPGQRRRNVIYISDWGVPPYSS